MPNLLSFAGSAVVLDVKGELFELTGGARALLGDDSGWEEMAAITFATTAVPLKPAARHTIGDDTTDTSRMSGQITRLDVYPEAINMSSSAARDLIVTPGGSPPIRRRWTLTSRSPSASACVPGLDWTGYNGGTGVNETFA